MLTRGLVTDEQLHSEHEIPPDCQPGEENSRNPQEQQVWSKCVFICDVLWLVIPSEIIAMPLKGGAGESRNWKSPALCTNDSSCYLPLEPHGSLCPLRG